ncbi:MAG TPA: alpha/beta hydrolase [Gammaproteobacteria bacterium]|nr:alpha/beta hydrolase [Gammaproteobacteria bacterium]
MASPQAAAIDRLFDSFIAAINANPQMSIEELRDLLEQCGDLARDPGGVDYFDVDAAGTPCLWAVPHGCREDRVLLALHGGGCVTGSRFSHRKLFAHVAKAVGCQALIVDYARAPEHQHPSQVDECLKVYEWLLNRGIKPNHIATIGDSAGGNLCTTVVLAAKAKGLPLPAAVMPLSPWYDMEATAPSFEKNAKVDRLISRELSLNMSQIFLGSASPRDPLANPLHADFTGYPPLYIQVGGFETIMDDATRVAERAKQAGVEVECEIWPEMQHVWHFMAGKAPEADAAIAKLAAWVRPKLEL